MHASRLDMLAVRHAPARAVIRCYDAETRGGTVIAFDLECGHVSHMAPHFDPRSVTHRSCTDCGVEAVKSDPAYASEFDAACDAAIAAIEAALDVEAPRNTATYCDGKAREFTAVLLDGDSVRYAAIAGQTCSDPLDCVALTESEAHEAGRVWALKRITRIGTDPVRFYRVERLPDGWSNDGRPAPAMVPQQCQQPQAKARGPARGERRYVEVRDTETGEAHRVLTSVARVGVAVVIFTPSNRHRQGALGGMLITHDDIRKAWVFNDEAEARRMLSRNGAPGERVIRAELIADPAR